LLAELILLTEDHISHLERWADFVKGFGLDKNIGAVMKSLKRVLQFLVSLYRLICDGWIAVQLLTNARAFCRAGGLKFWVLV